MKSTGQIRYECPKCGSPETKVFESRRSKPVTQSPYGFLVELGLTGYTRRRRRCNSCGHRWTTAEFEADVLEAVGEELKKLRRDQAVLMRFVDMAQEVGDASA